MEILELYVLGSAQGPTIETMDH